MITYEEIFENNKKWAEEKVEGNPAFFESLAANQNPDYLYIGCSDSRVTAEEVMGAAPGEVFVHRNIANIVATIDLNAISVISYAVQYLDVKHIIICGHYGCGGVKAAMQQSDMGILNPWLRNIRDVYRLHIDELNAIEDLVERYDRLVELNVQEQCINVSKLAVVQKAYLKKQYPSVHGWVFDMKNGMLKDLKLDFKRILSEIQQIYDLKESPDRNS